MLQLLSIIILAISGYFWLTTGHSYAIFMTGAASASCFWLFCFGIYNTFIQKQLSDIEELLKGIAK